MKQKALCLAVVSILTIALGSAWAAGTYLPFGDGFETGAPDGALNTNAWYTSTTGVARTENAAAKGYSTVDGSAQAAYISDDLSFIADTAAGDWTNVWCSFYTKVTAQGSTPDHLDSGTVAGFYVKNDGAIMAYSNNAWVSVATGVPTSGWIGFAVHLDYGLDKWDLYKTPDTYSYGDELTRINNNGPLAFKNGATPTEFAQATIEGTTYLDELTVSYDGEPVQSGSPSNAANAAVDIILGENLTGVLTKYFDPTDCGMDGPLGIALSSGLLQNDVVYVYESGSWTTLTCSGPGQGFTSSGGYPTLRPTSGVFVEFVASGNRQPARVAGFDDFQQPSATTPVVQGWNLTAVPHGATGVTISGLNLPTPQAGDQLWIKKLTGGYEIPIYYSGSAWLKGRTDVGGMALSGGQAFWYRRAGTGTNWDASGMTVN